MFAGTSSRQTAQMKLSSGGTRERIHSKRVVVEVKEQDEQLFEQRVPEKLRGCSREKGAETNEEGRYSPFLFQTMTEL